MINFVIKDNNDNIIYERYDEKGVLTEDEIAQIYEALENLDTNSVSISVDCRNMEATHGGHYSYSSLFHRSNKDEIFKETEKVIDEYNKHVAALSDHHLSDVASLARDGDADADDAKDTEDADGVDDCCDCGDGEDWLSDDMRDRLLHLLKRKFKYNADFAPYSWQKHIDRDGWCKIPKHNVDFGHYTLLGDCRGDVWGRDGCDGRGIRGDCGLGVIPGSFCGPDYIEDEKHRIRDKCDCCEGASEDVGPVGVWELGATSNRAVKDFIGYLRTRDSWATLLDEVGFYHDPDDDIGKQKLIDQFCEYMRKKENQECKDKREEKR